MKFWPAYDRPTPYRSFFDELREFEEWQEWRNNKQKEADKKKEGSKKPEYKMPLFDVACLMVIAALFIGPFASHMWISYVKFYADATSALFR